MRTAVRPNAPTVRPNVVLAHDRRRILHVNVTRHPTSGWTRQQLREVFPDEANARFLLRDGDATFDAAKTNSSRHVIVGTAKKSTATVEPRWFFRNVRQVCEGGLRRRGIRREIVRSETSNPSFYNSPCIRARPRAGS